MRIHHLAFRTDDLPRLERFYVEGLGLAVTKRAGERSVWLDAGGAIVMLEKREPGEPGVDPGAMDLVAFAVEPDRVALYTDRLGRAGVAIEARTAYSLYFRDPDGRRVGLSAYPVPLAPLG